VTISTARPHKTQRKVQLEANRATRRGTVVKPGVPQQRLDAQSTTCKPGLYTVGRLVAGRA